MGNEAARQRYRVHLMMELHKSLCWVGRCLVAPRDSAGGVIHYGLQAANFRASRLLESLNNIGGDDL